METEQPVSYVTTQEAIALSGLCGTALTYRVKAGRLRQWQHPGDKRRRLYDRAEIMALGNHELNVNEVQEIG